MPTSAGTVTVAREHRRRVVVSGAVLLLLAQMATAMWTSAADDAPTYDETAHIAAAAAYAVAHDLGWNVEHPPLLKLGPGLALRASGVNLPTTTAQFRSHEQYLWGQQILYAAGNDPARVLRIARLPMMAITLLVGLIVFGFSRDLFGTRGGLLALATYTVSPDVIAHGRLVTTDVGSAGFVVATCWMVWRARERDYRWIVAAGAALGLAASSKFNVLVYLPVILSVALWTTIRADGRVMRRLVLAGAAAVGSLAIVWLSYLSVDPSLRLEAVEPIALQVGRTATGPMATVADLLPFPEAYRVGLRYALAANTRPRPAFLLGDSYLGGRPAFYPLVLSMKTPVGVLALWAWSQLTLLRRPRRSDVIAAVTLPAAFVLVVGVLSGVNLGVRHVLPAVLLLIVGVGALGGPRRARTATKSPRPGHRSAIAWGLVGITALSAWLAHPAYLAYVNEPWGGPDNAYRLVADSNVDWGQDLARLGARLEGETGDRTIYLAYFGTGIPGAYGIDAEDLREVEDVRSIRNAIIAISVTEFNSNRERYRPLGRPDAQVGHSILVFER